MSHTLQDIAKVLIDAKNILVIAHTQPDGDTLGSCYSIQNAFKKLGKTVDICCDSDMPEKYHLIFNSEKLILPHRIELKYDVVVALDCADKSRLGKSYKIFKNHENTINIDHHITNDNFAKFNYVVEASSTGQLVYELLLILNIEIDGDTARALYTAISTDTGNFTYSNTSETCMDYTSKLIEKFDLRDTADILFRRRSLSATKLIGRAISRLEIYNAGKIAAMTILKSDFKELDAEASECDSIVNYAREIDTVVIAAFFREMNTGVKVSLRSKGDFDIGAVAVSFGGGGHKNASGCVVGGKLEDVKKKVLKSLTELL